MLHVIYWLGMRYPFLNYFLQFYSHCIVTHFTFKGCKFTVYIFTSFFLIINQIILKCVNCLHYSYYQPVIDALIYICSTNDSWSAQFKINPRSVYMQVSLCALTEKSQHTVVLKNTRVKHTWTQIDCLCCLTSFQNILFLHKRHCCKERVAESRPIFGAFDLLTFELTGIVPLNDKQAILTTEHLL